MENNDYCGYIDQFATNFIMQEAEKHRQNLAFIANCNECLPLLKFIAIELENQNREMNSLRYGKSKYQP